MKNYFKQLMSKMEGEINKIYKSEQLNVEQAKKCKSIVLNHYTELSNFASSYYFKSEQEEIYYFKTCQPQIMSQLLYYSSVSKLLKRMPIGCKKVKQKYINQHIKKIQNFYESNIELINYYRSENTDFDRLYFLRKNISSDIIPISRLLNTDKNQITNGSFVIADLLSNIKLNQFLEIESEKLNRKVKITKKPKTPNSDFFWTGSKVALTELIYALFSQGVINKGGIEIKTLVREFESFFNIKLGDPYRSFAEIKQRKKMPTQFIDSLKNSLLEHINELENTD